MVKNNQYEESDFVDVVDENDKPLPGPVPKQWIGTDLLPAGVKKAGKKAGKKAADKKTDDPKPVEIPDGDPTAEWTIPQLTAYAAKQDPPIELGDATLKDDIVKLVVKPANPAE